MGKSFKNDASLYNISMRSMLTKVFVALLILEIWEVYPFLLYTRCMHLSAWLPAMLCHTYHISKLITVSLLIIGGSTVRSNLLRLKSYSWCIVTVMVHSLSETVRQTLVIILSPFKITREWDITTSVTNGWTMVVSLWPSKQHLILFQVWLPITTCGQMACVQCSNFHVLWLRNLRLLVCQNRPIRNGRLTEDNYDS